MKPLSDSFRWLALTFCCLAGSAQAELVWQPVSSDHGSHRGPKQFQLRGIETSDARVALIRPDLEAVPLALAAGAVRVKGTGTNNYHALVAIAERGGRRDTATRYLYMHGKPSGHSPSELLARPATGLQIIPAPLPREHWRYETRKAYRFELRFDGELLPEQPVTLRTAAGSLQDLLTDREGILTLVLPEDFDEIKKGRRKNKPGEWQLTSYIQQNGVIHHSSLSAPYSPSPANWQSYALGWLVAGLGFGGGLLINRRLPAQARRRKSR